MSCQNKADLTIECRIEIAVEVTIARRGVDNYNKTTAPYKHNVTNHRVLI